MVGSGLSVVAGRLGTVRGIGRPVMVGVSLSVMAGRPGAVCSIVRGMGGPVMPGCVAMMTMVAMVAMAMRHHPAEDLGGLGLAQGKLRLVAQAHGKGAAPQQAGGNDHQRDAIGKSEVGQTAAHHGVEVAKDRVGRNALDMRMGPFLEL